MTTENNESPVSSNINKNAGQTTRPTTKPTVKPTTGPTAKPTTGSSRPMRNPYTTATRPHVNSIGNGDESAQSLRCLGQFGLTIAQFFIYGGTLSFFVGLIMAMSGNFDGFTWLVIGAISVLLIGTPLYHSAAKEKALAKASIRSEQTYQLLKELQSQRETVKPASDSSSNTVHTVRQTANTVHTVKQASDADPRLQSIEDQLKDIKATLEEIKAALK